MGVVRVAPFPWQRNAKLYPKYRAQPEVVVGPSAAPENKSASGLWPQENQKQKGERCFSKTVI